MERLECDVLVIGGGIVGSAIARDHAARADTVLVDARRAGATQANQRWLHSGAIQESDESRAHLFAEHARWLDAYPALVGPPRGRLVAGTDESVERWTAAWDRTGIPYAAVGATDLADVGRGSAAAAFASPDRPIDFARVVADLTSSTVSRGGRVHAPSEARSLLVDDGRVRGAICVRPDGTQVEIAAQTVVVAAGQWMPELCASIGVALPVERWKSHVLRLEGELVPSITAWLDGPRITAVPINGATLVCDATRMAAQGPDDLSSDPEWRVEIYEKLARCLPGLTRAPVLGVHAGIKTEARSAGGSRAQTQALYRPSDHGIASLWIAIPGKACLAFALAREVTASVRVDVGSARRHGRRRASGRARDMARSTGGT